MREETLLLAIAIVGTAALPTTTEPSWAPTGRLSQFRGFVTPRTRDIPEDVRMMYASVWATWSAWSFCSNGVRMRVRACNTVRGFSCLGPNQETRPCDAILPPSGDKKTTTDYDVIDPWEADRREAMKQLYPDDQETPKDINSINIPSPIRRNRITAPPRPRVVDHSLVGFEERRPANEADGSPGSDPEKLFGAKQFAVKSITPDEFKETRHEDLGSSELNRLVAMTAKSSEEALEEKKPIDDRNSFEDISLDTTTLSPETSTTTPVEIKITTERQRSSGTTTHPIHPISPFHSLGLVRYFNKLTNIPPNAKILTNIFNRSAKMRTKMLRQTHQHVYPLEFYRKSYKDQWKRSSKRLTELMNVPLKPRRKQVLNKASVQPLYLEGLIQMGLGDNLQISFHSKQKKKKNLHSGEMENGFYQVSSFGQINERNRVFANPTKKDRDEKISKAIGEEIAKTFSDPEDSAKEILDTSFKEAEVMGKNPVRVKPQLPPTVIDDNLEDLLEVVEGPSEDSETTTTTKEPSEPTELDIPEPTELPLAETDLIKAVKLRNDEEVRRNLMTPPDKRKRNKTKSFGFTGFALKKAVGGDRSYQKLHDGEISRVQFSANLAPDVEETSPTTTTTTTAPITRTFSNSDTIHSPTHQLEEPEISMDTLNALDWMLKNMTQAAAKEDTAFLTKVTEAGIGPREEEEVKDSFPILPSEFGDEQVPEKPKKQRKLKRKLKKVKKIEVTKLHDGEYTPKFLNKKKMFPKFKARSMKIKRTRALGVRTINSEKDKAEIPTKESLTAEMGNPNQIFEEVKQLQAEMQQLEKQIGQYNSQQVPSIKALNEDPLLEELRLDLGTTKFSKKEPLPPVSNGPDPLRILTPLESTPIETRWGIWSEWGECFCGIQVRTRICIFGGNSSGCKGPTHESRTCSGGSCPSNSHSDHSVRTGVFEYNAGPVRPRRLQITR